MGHIALATPALFYVRWHCTRCGHRNGVARTTSPFVGPETPEAAMRELLAALRKKLIKIHMKSGCIATVEDFILERMEHTTGKPVVGLV